jgi:hypothetical protein
MATFEEAALSWAQNINDWYEINATVEEMRSAFNTYFKDKLAYDGTSYVEMFFKSRDGGWTRHLDTADREEMADQVELMRGNPRIPTYADLGGNLLNKAMK